jgi:Flp pilus assembly protein TadD
MARTAAQRNKRAKSNARRKSGNSGGAQINPNDTLFFPRLRTHAKWMFVVLAIVFSISFVAFGVGSGSTGISDIFNNGLSLFGGGSSSGTSISKAQKAIAKHPKVAQGYRDLATALETKNRNDEAILALESYTRLKPSDTAALSELAGLYLRQVDAARSAAQVAQAAASPVTGGGLFTPASTSKLGQALATDPIVQAVGAKSSQIVSDQYTKAQTAGANAISTYKRLAKATPDDSSVQLELAQAAEGIGNTAVAIAAYKQFLKLAPQDPSATAVKQRIKQLQPAKK